MTETIWPRAWLHRKGKSTWMFEPCPKYGQLVHKTNRGSVYAIIASHGRGVPFWIGKWHNGVWLRCDGHLRARSIEFEDAGKYVFPIDK
jgi:hypothetical protein